MKLWTILALGCSSVLCAACGGADDAGDGQGGVSEGAQGAASDCTAGEAEPCACPDGTEGMQVCSADGTSLGECMCSGEGSSAGGPSGGGDTGGAGESSGAGAPTSATDPASGSDSSGSGSDSSGEDPGSTGSGDDSGSAEGTEPPPSVDPNAPVVEVPGLACGGVLDENLLPPFVEIGGRQVFIDYACDKPSGTPVTFILNLHGTMELEEGKIYQRGYFPTFEYAASHDFVVATPKSVVSQWGNGDGGQDEPHLMAVIDWVYENFAGFDIRQMWIVGHSWGAMYTRTFACKQELADKVHGVVLMSGGTAVPGCADRLAIIGTVGETDIVPGEVDQSGPAALHGCAGATTMNLGNNVVTEWPSCDPGWAHKNYLMLGKGHGFDPVDWPDEDMVADMVEVIASTRQ